MSNNTLSVPGVAVNNVPIEIVPNSLTFKMGTGETNVRSASAGGGSSRSVHSEDAESRIGMVKFSMYVTDETVNLAAEWKANTGANFVSLGQPATAPKSGSNMSMINDPDFEATADGVVEIEFEGDPLSNNS